MAEAQRWSVTYTKHVTQKRKVYQDGYLELQSSRQKVMIYDVWDKVLESRFVKKDEVIKSGETLAFSSYLVDIGEQCGRDKPMNGQEKDTAEKSGPNSASNSTTIDRKPTFGKTRARGINLSPSQKMIREFKKNEAKKCVSSPSCLDMTKTSKTEWQVLYTTHITQKAKKFHDGFLQLVAQGSQGRQVMLYDITRRHLNSRFLKKDETVSSGESLSFEGHIVEIGEQEGDHKPVNDLNSQEKSGEAVGKTYIANIQLKAPTKKKFSCEIICPEKLINLNASSSKTGYPKSSLRTPANEPRHTDFKKIEAKISVTEWQVLYTSQVTQKVKNFQDGFLQLVVRASQGRQVILYDRFMRQLNSKFLKNDEIVCSGESLSFEGHLVEIGEKEGDHEPVKDLTFQEKNCKVVEKTYIANIQAKSPTGETPGDTWPQQLTDNNDSSSKMDNMKSISRTPANEPRRAVHDILSILQKPNQRKVDLHTSDANQTKDYTEECNGSAKTELRETTCVQNPVPEVKINTETLVVLNAAENCGVSKNGRESPDMSSMFCMRAGVTNCTTPIFDVETNYTTLMPSSSSVEPHILLSLDSEGQMPIKPASLAKSIKREKPDNFPELFSCEGFSADTTAAATYVWSSRKLPKLHEDNNGSSSRCRDAYYNVAAVASNDLTSNIENKALEQNFPTKEMVDIPSFDLGF